MSCIKIAVLNKQLDLRQISLGLRLVKYLILKQYSDYNFPFHSKTSMAMVSY